MKFGAVSSGHNHSFLLSCPTINQFNPLVTKKIARTRPKKNPNRLTRNRMRKSYDRRHLLLSRQKRPTTHNHHEYSNPPT